MKKFQQMILGIGLASTVGLFVTPASAQTNLPADAFPTIVTPHKQAVNYRERTLCYDITANVDYTVTSKVDWATVRKTDDGNVYVHLKMNPDGEARKGEIVFANAEKGLSETLVITQDRNTSVQDIPTDERVKVSSSSHNFAQGGEGVDKTLDGDYGTIYHSPYSGGSPNPAISPSSPAILTYNFKNVEQIDYVNYVPRSGNNNGNFKEVEVYVKCTGDADYRLYGKYDWKGSGSPSTVKFDGGLKNPESIRFNVLGGVNDFASCAEMEFYMQNQEREQLFSIFADELCTKLKEGTTQAEIDAVDDDFVRSLAQSIFDGTYDMNYRVAEYEAHIDPQILSDQWNCPGKKYNQLEGVTGINITPGKHAVIVSGIPEGETVSLSVYAWFSQDINEEGKGGGPSSSTYALKNGINVINYTQANDKDGLAYICYYTANDPKTLANVKVHFVNGQVNGYLSPDKTNEEMYKLCANAKNTCIDVAGRKAHAVWTAAGLRDYCKATDNTSLGYRQYMNVIDSLVQWEHDVLGFTKYGREPDNTTFAYVNYTYYMFQGGLGVSFMYDQERRVLNCNTIVNHDSDAIWGLSHEWGHQHQMTPYFCWTGLSEVTNNMNSYYNVMKMGYNFERGGWEGITEIMLDPDAKDYRITYGPDGDNALSHRGASYRYAENYRFSPELYELCIDMKNYVQSAKPSDFSNGKLPGDYPNTTIPSVTENKLKALSIMERGAGDVLAPFILLHNYMWFKQNYHDFYPDLYESLRQNDDENGSQIEKKGEVDKYELIASAQNNNKNGKLAQLQAKYPNSCWIKDKYITADHCWQFENSAPYVLNFIRKASRLSGYNLVPYFEQWGFLRCIAFRMDDYGWKNTLLTENMYNEFITDMSALVESGELKEMPEGMLEDMMKQRHINIPGDKLFPTPKFPN